MVDSSTATPTHSRTERIRHGSFVPIGFTPSCTSSPCGSYSDAWTLQKSLALNWQLSNFVLADELTVTAVLLLPLLASWACLSSSIDSSNEGVGVRHCGSIVLLQLRHTLLLPLIPVILLTGVSDVGRLYLPGWSDTANNACQATVVFLVVLGVPWIVRLAWPTKPLPTGPQRARLEALFRRADVTISQVLLWDTGGRMANAAVTGILPMVRFLLVSDALIANTSDAELAAVAAHEAGHLRHRHLPRLALSVVVLMLLILLLTLLASAAGAASTTALPVWLPIATVAAIVAWAPLHGRLARLLEHQADGAACRILTIDSADHRPIDSASVELFSETLRAIGANPRGDWLHPAPTERIAKLREWSENPAALDRFNSRLNRISWLHTAAAACLLAFCAVLA